MKKDEEYFRDIDGKKIPSLNPPQMYSSKKSCVNLFKRFCTSPDVIEASENSDLLNSIYKIAGQMPEIFDFIYKNFPKEFDRHSSKKFKSNRLCKKLYLVVLLKLKPLILKTLLKYFFQKLMFIPLFIV
jgi:hypothetical protein